MVVGWFLARYVRTPTDSSYRGLVLSDGLGAGSYGQVVRALRHGVENIFFNSYMEKLVDSERARIFSLAGKGSYCNYQLTQRRSRCKWRYTEHLMATWDICLAQRKKNLMPLLFNLIMGTFWLFLINKHIYSFYMPLHLKILPDWSLWHH